jgi:hypothetical protein
MAAFASIHLAAGMMLALAGWVMPRTLARARRTALAAALLDMAPLGTAALLLGLASGRPLFAGAVTLALGAGFTLTDYTMRQVLREPVVFSEMAELPELFLHPHLYIPFAGPGLVLGGAAAAIAAGAALLVLEPALWAPHPVAALAVLIGVLAVGWLFARAPLLGCLAALLRRLRPSGEPFADAAALGPFGMILAHAIIARSERGERQRALAAPVPVRSLGEAGRSIILVQCESFFDARRLGPVVPREFLAGFAACSERAGAHGRLQVPGWGANTMRAEFAVLTGLPETALGYDRFNPYYALARVPLESQVWRLRRAGYSTLCLHPFDRRFFRRDLAMPALGFERFLGRETIGGARVPPYCPDPEFARTILAALDEARPPAFIFAITMGNHGPWLGDEPPLDPAVARLFDPADLPDGRGLLRYLDGLRRSDEMLLLLMEGLKKRGYPALLGFYGDHLPSLPGAFDHFGLAEPHSDYAIWPSTLCASEGLPVRLDLPSHELGRWIVDRALAAGQERRWAAEGGC